VINTIYRLKSPKIFEESFEEINVSKNEVLIRPYYLSICKADQRYYRGERENTILNEKLPLALVHEGIGEIIYSKSSDFTNGDIVVMIPNILYEDDNIIAGNYLYSSKFMSSDTDGFLKEYLVLNENRVLKIPKTFNLEVSSFIELLSVAVHAISKFKQFSKTKKESIGVWGDGNMGYIVSLFLKFSFPDSSIYVFGKDKEKSSFFSFIDEFYLIHEIPKNLKVDHGFECVGGEKSQSAISQIVNYTNPEGSLALLGVSEYPINIETRKVLEKGLVLYGVSRSEYDDFKNAIAILKKYPKIISYLENIISLKIDINNLEDLNHAFEEDYHSNFGKTILSWNI
jgi:ribitol-5-phosphate 2-dehydrogenase